LIRDKVIDVDAEGV